jgi:DNA-binding MarR family transcriptional regulator
MSKIVLGKSEGRRLRLPTDVATQTILIVGKRGSGKSSTATRLAEQLIESKVQIAVLDPPDAWWGLKSSVDGNSEGFPVYVFGGRHGDLPLESTAGALMADLLVDDGINAVMSLRQFSNLERSRFSIDFADRLFQRNTRPLMLFCEEAHRLMPQNLTEYGKGSRVEEMLGKMLKLQTEGRTSGIGLTAITQRPANLHKTFTTQAEILIAHRTLGPQDRDAIEGWIKYHRQDEQKEEMLASLAELKTGDAWIWAPDFPEEKPIGLKRVHFLLPQTFDSRRTPRPGEHLAEPKHLAAVDLEKLKERMAATIERAKAADPQTLRAEIRSLRAQLRVESQKSKAAGTPMSSGAILADPRAIDRAVRETESRFLKAVRERDTLLKKLAVDLGGLAHFAGKILETAQRRPADVPAPAPPQPNKREPPAIRVRIKEPVAMIQIAIPEERRIKHSTEDGLTPKQQAILRALWEFEQLGRTPTARSWVAARAIMAVGGGTFNNYVGNLRSRGLIEYAGGGMMHLTEEGRAAAPQSDHILTSEALVESCLRLLTPKQQEMLKALVAAYPQAVTNEELAEAAGMTAGGGTFNNYRGALRSAGMAVYVGGKVKAADWLFVD